MRVVSAGKKLVDKLVEECTEKDEKVKLAKITSAEDKDKHKCSSILSTVNVGIGTYFVYYKYMNHVKKTAVKERFNYQTTFDY